MYRNLPSIINGERYVALDARGAIITVENPEEFPQAQTGIDFFINNWKKIKWNLDGENKSRAKKEDLFSNMEEDEVFIDKWLIIPAMYRDINLHGSASRGKIDMDEVNLLYIKLINYASSESITFTSSFLTQSNLQNTLVEIHNLLSKKPAGKNGLIHSGIMGKPIDYAVVSVLSAPRFNSPNIEASQVPFNYIGVPLYTLCAMFFPMVVKNLEDMFFDIMHTTEISFFDDIIDGEETKETLDSEALNKLVKSYIKDKTKGSRTVRFTLTGTDNAAYKPLEEKLGRPYTVTDLLYRAVADVVYDKHVIATRYPISGSESIIFCKVKILTTENTIDLTNGNSQPGTFDFEFMRTYPYLPTDKKGNIDTNKVQWIDTVVPNNAFLAGLGGDYDVVSHLLRKIAIFF